MGGSLSLLMARFLFFNQFLANKAAIKAMLVNRVGSFPRNFGFFDSIPKSRPEDHACASTFPKPQILWFSAIRDWMRPPWDKKEWREAVAERGSEGEKEVFRVSSTWIERRGISSVLSPILDKRAPVLSFAEVVKKGSLSSVPWAANSKEGAEKEKFWIAKPRAPSSLA